MAKRPSGPKEPTSDPLKAHSTPPLKPGQTAPEEAPIGWDQAAPRTPLPDEAPTPQAEGTGGNRPAAPLGAQTEYHSSIYSLPGRASGTPLIGTSNSGSNATTSTDSGGVFHAVSSTSSLQFALTNMRSNAVHGGQQAVTSPAQPNISGLTTALPNTPPATQGNGTLNPGSTTPPTSGGQTPPGTTTPGAGTQPPAQTGTPINNPGTGQTPSGTATPPTSGGQTPAGTTSLGGVNQLAITGTDSGSTTEDQTASTNGQLALSGAQGAQQWQVDTPTGQYGQLSVDASGQWSYQLDNGSTAVQSLAAGERVSDTFLITATSNGQSTQATITVDINGTNDGPTLIPGAQVHALLDMANTSDTSGTLGATDIDHHAQLSWSGVDQQGQFGHFHLDEATGQWHYQIDPTLPAAQALASGASASETFTLAVTDEHGSSAQQQIIVTVMGTNDAPVLAAVPVQNLLEGSQPVTGQLSAQDPDGPGGLTFSSGFPVPGFSLSPDGSYSFNPGHSAYTPMAAGSVQHIDIPVKVTDPSGGSDTQTISIVLTGTNQAPVVSTIAPLAVNEGDPTVHGQLQAVDGDTGDTVTFSAAQPIPGLTVNADGAFSFNPADRHYNSLALGQSHTYSIAVTATDSRGASHTQDLVITLTGTNDVPVINAIAPAFATEGGPVIHGQIGSIDPDLPDTATYSGGQQVPGFSLSHDGSYSFDPSHSSYQSLAAGQRQQLTIPVTVTDAAGASDTQNLLIQITGTNHTPVVNAIATQAVDEDAATISGQITGTDIDTGDSITYTISGQPVDGLSLNTDGSWSFDPSESAYQYLSEGQRQVITVPVTGTDQTGATSTQDLVITLTGTNDAPTVATALTDQVATEDAAFSFAVPAGSFADIDRGDALTLTTGNLPGWLSFDAATGTFTGTPTNADVGHTNITVTAADNHGATVASTFNLVVNNLNDSPLLTPISSVTLHEDGTLATGQLTATDPDTGDTLTYAAAIPVAGLTLNTDGSWSFDPSDAAYQQLAQGQPQTLTIPVTVTDAAGATDTQNLVITIIGTNDAPIVSVVPTVSTTEDGNFVSGGMTGTDMDAGDGISYALQTAVDGLAVNADGSWNFDPSHASYQPLADGQQQTVTATIVGTDSQGASDSQNLTITLTGTNDVPVISGSLTGTVVEDKTLSVSGALNVKDADTGESSLQAGVIQGRYGELTLDANGSWVYHLDNALDDVQHLAAGEILLDTITVKTADGTTQDISIQVNGTNDKPFVDHAAADQSATQDAAVSFTLPVNTFDDVDTLDTHTLSASNLPTWLHFDASTGTFTGTPHNNDVGTVQITVTDTDAQGASVATTFNLVVTNVNDAPTLNPIATVAVDEDGTQATGQLSATDPDTGDTLTYTSSPVAGFTLNSDGSWSFAPSDAAYQSLPDGSVQQLTIPVTVTDAAGATDTQSLTINVTGTNDAASITGVDTGTVTEDQQVTSQGRLLLQGQLTVADADAGEAVFQMQMQNTGSGGYGSFFVTQAGHWVYDVDNTNPAVQQLGDNQHLTDTYAVTSADGTQHKITVTIAGTNDAPVVSHAVVDQMATEDAVFHFSLPSNNFADIDTGDSVSLSAGQLPAWLSFDSATGTFTGTPGNSDVGTTQISVTATDTHGVTVTTSFDLHVANTNDAPVLNQILQVTTNEDDAQVSGQVSATDPDAGDSLTYSTTAPPAGFSLKTDGSWSFDPSNAAYQSLAQGQPHILTIPVIVQDASGATDQQNLMITLTGTNDAPVLSSIANVAAKEGDAVVTGTLVGTDVDGGDSLTFFNTVPVPGLTIHADGSYSFNPADGAYNHLPQNQQQIISVPVTVADGHGGTDQRQLQITLTGTNDVPVIGGIDHAIGSVATASGGKVNITGQLSIVDLDAGESHFQQQLISGSYGVLNINQNGQWNYVANAHQPAFNQLHSSAALSETFMVRTADGTRHQVQLEIKGQDTPAIIGGVSSALMYEDQAGTITHQLTINDPNAGEAAFVPVDQTTQYGHFTLSPKGEWRYVLDNSNSAVQALTATDSLQDRILVGSVDGTPQQISIHITGANDVAVIGGMSAGVLTEDTSVSATGKLEAGGQLSIADADTGEGHFVAVQNLPGDQGYGHFSIDTSGNWHYQVDNNQAAIQQLTIGSTPLTESTVVFSADGTQHTITITIQGSNDTPVVSHALVTQSATEDTTFTFSVPANTFADIDTGDTLTLSTGTLPSWLNFDADSGAFTGTPTNADVGTTALTVTATDSHGAKISATFDLSVADTNDAPTLTPIASISVTEDGQRASGHITATDPDTGDTLHYSVAAPVDGLTFDSDGNWSFDPSHSAYQALAGGQSVTLDIPITVADAGNASDSGALRITVTGTDDAPIIGGITHNNVFEDQHVTAGKLVANGQLQVTDIDSGESHFNVAMGNSDQGYGSFIIGPSGAWTYTADNSQTVIQQLSKGQTLQDSFTVQSADGTSQTVTITITGTNDAPVVAATMASPANFGATLEDTPLSVTNTDLLRMIGASDVDGADTLTIVDATSTHGTFTQQGNGYWRFTPETDYDGQNVPVEIRVSDGQSEVVAHGFVDISPVTDLSEPNITLTSQQEVINTGDSSSLGRIQIDQLSSTPITSFTLEINILAKPVADTQNWTGPVVLNMGHAGNNNFLTLWNPGNMRLGGLGDPHTDLNLGDGNIHRLTITWDSSSGDFILYDNGQEILSQTWHQGASLPSDLYLIVGGKNHAANGIGNFYPSEHFEGDVFNVAMTQRVLSPAEIQLAPLASQVDVNTGLELDIRSVGGHVTDVTGSHQVTDHGAIGVNTGVDTSLNLPAPGSTLNLQLQAPPPADPDDSIGGIYVSGFLAGTGLSDGIHHYIFNDPHDILDVTGWNISAITAALPAGISENMQLRLTVETNGPAGAAEAHYTEAVILNPLLPIPNALVSGDDLATTDEDTSVSGILTVTDADPGESYFEAGIIISQWGELAVDAQGGWTYTPNNQADTLRPGDTVTDALVVKTADGSTHSINITLTGSEDGAVITGADSASLIEDHVLECEGALNVTDPDAGDAHFIAATTAGTFGTLTINTDGNWRFTADSTAANLQALGAGEQQSETFTVQSVDGTRHDIIISIAGTNDSPIIAHAISHQTVGEDNAFSLVLPTNTFTDMDKGDTLSLTTGTLPAWLSFDAATATFSGTPTNTYVGTTKVSVTATDSQGARVTSTFDVTVDNTNDAPTLTQIATVSVDEDGTQATGQLRATDPDTGDTLTYSASIVDGFTLNSDGSWSFDPSDAAYQSLPDGQIQQLIIPVTVTDAAGETDSENLIVTVTGTNNAAVITGADSGTVAEDQQVTTRGKLSAQGQLQITDVDAGEDAFQMQMHSTSSAGYGSVVVTASGHWIYEVDNSNPAVQQLGENQHLTDTFTATSVDGTQHTVTITIEGSNDTPTVAHALTTVTATEDAAFTFAIPVNTFTDVDAGDSLNYRTGVLPSWLSFDGSTGTFSGTPTDSDVGTTQITVETTDSSGGHIATTFDLTVDNVNDAPALNAIATVAIDEDGAKATGQLSATDPDTGDTLTYSSSSVDGFTLNADGSWSFDPSDAAYQSLSDSQPQQLTIPITVTDAAGDTDTQDLTITVTGTNDVPVITSAAQGAVTEDAAVSRTGGQLAATDVDSGDTLHWELVGPSSASKGLYGQFALVPDTGQWVYRLESTSADHLAENQQETDTFTVRVTDSHGASTDQTVTITVTGSNDVPKVSHVITTQAAAEDAAFSFTVPTDTFADTDTSDTLTLSTSQLPAWLSFDAATGIFSGTPTNGDVGTTQVTVTATDNQGGHTSTTFDLNVANINDAPTLTPIATQHLDEGDTQVTGQLTATDPDTGDTLTYSTSATTVDGFTLNSDGSWSFNPANHAYNHLPDGHVQTLTIPITVTDTSGDTDTGNLIIQVTGTNDAPMLLGSVSYNAVEDGHVVHSRVTITDLDDGQGAVGVTVTSTASVPGFTLNADGSFSFDPSDAAYQHLPDGQVQDIVIPVTLTDASGATRDIPDAITLHITGTNDVPAVTGVLTATVTEDQQVTTRGKLSAQGQLQITDVDAGEDAFQMQMHSTSSAGYGSVVVTASGHWIYEVDNSNPAVQQLGENQHLTDTFTATSVDGTQHTVTITIEGSNDTPTVAHALTTVTATEDAAFTFAIPVNTFTDVDAGDSLNYRTGVLPSWLSFDGSTGTFSGTPTDSDVGTTQITVETTDSSGGHIATTFDLTVDNVNNAPTLTPIATVAVDENGAKATGQLTATDPDAGDTLTYSSSTVAGFVLKTDGSWSFDPSDAAYQSLADGQVRPLSIAVTVTDNAGETDTQNLLINVTGSANGARVAFGGADTGAVTEDTNAQTVYTKNILEASGTLTATDTNGHAVSFVSELVTGTHGGQLEMMPSGNWEAFIDNDAPRVQALNTGDHYTETFTVHATDGTTHNITVTVQGQDETAQILPPPTLDVQIDFTAGHATSAATGPFSMRDMVDHLMQQYGQGPTTTFSNYGGNPSGSDQIHTSGNIIGTYDLKGGDDTLVAEGTNFGQIWTGEGNDVVVLKGQNHGDIQLGQGNDFLLVSGTINSGIDGGDGVDTVILGGYTSRHWNIASSFLHNFENIMTSDGVVVKGDASAFPQLTAQPSYEYTLQVLATVHSGDESISAITIDQLPSGVTLQDNSGQALTPNADGSYSITPPATGSVALVLVADHQLNPNTADFETSFTFTNSATGVTSNTVIDASGQVVSSVQHDQPDEGDISSVSLTLDPAPPADTAMDIPAGADAQADDLAATAQADNEPETGDAATDNPALQPYLDLAGNTAAQPASITPAAELDDYLQLANINSSQLNLEPTPTAPDHATIQLTESTADPLDSDSDNPAYDMGADVIDIDALPDNQIIIDDPQHPV